MQSLYPVKIGQTFFLNEKLGLQLAYEETSRPNSDRNYDGSGGRILGRITNPRDDVDCKVLLVPMRLCLMYDVHFVKYKCKGNISICTHTKKKKRSISFLEIK
jgi:hypothetical protein